MVAMLATTIAIAQTPAQVVVPIPVVLYDGALGGTPNNQQMVFAGFGSQSASNGATTFDTTTSNTFQGGYTAESGVTPTLDAAEGYRLRFRVQVQSEAHVSDHRAGFSVILLGANQQGIELGFWSDRIWAQADGIAGDGSLFTQAEGVAIDTTVMQTYDLAIKDSTYTLEQDGAILLTGRVRDYRAFSGLFDVYETPNFIFLGDNTTSAQATIRLAYVAFNPAYQAMLPLVIGGTTN
jgi:hypothetical protein